MKLSELREKLKVYEQGKGWTKQFASYLKKDFNISTPLKTEAEQIQLLRQFIDALEAHSNKLEDDIEFASLIAFCKAQNKVYLFEDSYLHSNRESAAIFKQWRHQEHNKTVAEPYKLPTEILIYIFEFLNKNDLTPVAFSCKKFADIIRYNNFTLFKKAFLPVDYSTRSIERKQILKHNNSVADMKVSSKGNIITGSLDKTVGVWNAKTGKCKILKGHAESVHFVLIAPNGNIVSASGDNTIRIWDADTGQCKHVLTGHTGSIHSLVIAPNGNIVSAAGDKTILIWDANTGQCKHVLTGHKDTIRSLVIAPNGDIVSASDDKTIRIWDANTGQCKHVLTGHTGSVHLVVIAPNGDIVSASNDHIIRIWDVNTGQCKRALSDGWFDDINSIAITANGDIIASAGGKVIRWRFPYLKPQMQTSHVENSKEDPNESNDDRPSAQGKTYIPG